MTTPYESAVFQNDEAHRRVIRSIGDKSNDTVDRQELFKSIQREARMWLEHLHFIHYQDDTTRTQ